MKRTVGPVLLSALLAGSCATPPRAEPDVRSGVVAVESGETYYEIAGSGDAIVLIHGGFGDRRMWDDHFLALAVDHRVVRYDLRGFGRSPAPQADYSPVDDLRLLLDALGIERATLVGNSMGGALSIDFTLVHPERVEALVLVASGVDGFPAPEERAPFAADLDAMNAAFSEAATKGPERGIELWLASPMVSVASASPSTRDALRRMITENTGMFRLEHWPFEVLEPRANFRLDEIRVPTLVIAGERDTPLMRAAAERAASGIARARLVVIEGADHLPQMVAPQRFREVLLEFLARS
jgi:pimeloyl-ACP methyl ester carboxylesterase